MNKITLHTLDKLKQRGEKITCITSYDASFTRLIDLAQIESILVGDSLGMVIQGHKTTIPVTLEDICYHTRCVKRADPSALIIADMPFLSYVTIETALMSAKQLMQAGAEVIKVEGGSWLAETIRSLSQCGVPVCGHLGLTPQSIHQLGGYRTQGKKPEEARILIEDAISLEKAGARLLVLECIPSPLAQEITHQLQIPTIGIGAGKETDGQILVLHDILGAYPDGSPKFAKDFLTGHPDGLRGALSAYRHAVKTVAFPEN